MAKKSTKDAASVPAPERKEVVLAATNDPSLAPDSFKFTLGEKEFTVVHLPYEDYVKFLEYLSPLIEGMMGHVAQFAKGVPNLPGIDLTSFNISLTGVFRYCEKELPEMALLVCRQSHPDYTREELLKEAQSPIALAKIVLRQIKRNEIIKELADFFPQIATMLK